MAGTKRKRTSTRFRPKVSKQTKALMRPRVGQFRTGGFYGRYNTPGSTEKKYYDSSLSLLFDATPEYVTYLPSIVQGTGETQRIGRKVNITSIQLRIRLTQATTAGRYAVRLVLVWDRQFNGSAPTWDEVFAGSGGAMNFPNLSNTERFRVLKDWMWGGGAGAATTSDNWASLANTVYAHNTRIINYYRKCNISMEFNGTSGGSSEIKSNNIFLMAGSMDSDDTMSANIYYRLRFTDN